MPQFPLFYPTWPKLGPRQGWWQRDRCPQDATEPASLFNDILPPNQTCPCSHPVSGGQGPAEQRLMANTRWHRAGGTRTALSCLVDPGPHTLPKCPLVPGELALRAEQVTHLHTPPSPSLGAAIQLQLESSGCSNSATVSHPVKDVTNDSELETSTKFTGEEGR